MKIWNCSNIHKYFETPGRVSEVLLNVPAVAEFFKNGLAVTQKDTKAAKEIAESAFHS